MRQRHRILAWALAGALVMASVPVRAEGNRVVYVSMNGSGENGGMTVDSPLNSIYAAQELLPEGGTILVTDTIYISGEREYLLNDGITLQAADGLEGPVFEIEEGGTLTLNNVVIIGNSSTLIANGGVLKMDDSVSLQVKDGAGVGCVYTAEGAATWLNDELVAGTASAGAQESGEETEPKGGQDETEEETESETEKEPDKTETESEAEKKEPDKTETESEAEKKQDGTEKESETGKRQDETEKESETERKQDGTEKESETERKQDETEKKQSETEGLSETEKGQKETGNISQTEKGQPETSIPIREKAVETVKNAIIALNIHSRNDVKKLLAVSQAYDGLTESEKEAIPAKIRKLLESAKEMAAAYNHTQLGVSVYGNLPWYVQFQVKLTDVGEKQENGLKILVPYELKLWNLYTDSVYTLPEGETVTVTMPVPDVEIDGEFTVFHYKSDGSVETIRPVINGNMMSFETSSFSPFSVAGSTVIAGIGVGSGSPSGKNTGNENTSNPGNDKNPGSTGTQTPSTENPGGTSETQGVSESNHGVYAAVNTGDDTNVIPAVVTMLAALLAIVGIILHKKKGKHE